MPSTDPNFPHLAEICDQLAQAIAAREDAPRALAELRLSAWGVGALLERLEARRAALIAAAEMAYGEELLPRVLGGKWVSASWRGWPQRLFGRRLEFDPRIGSALGVLADHALVHRRSGRRGSPTWDGSVVIGRPYAILDADGRIFEWAHAAATVLAGFDIAAWVRPDLSAWMPGSTQLTLLARYLNSDTAKRFGFLPIVGETRTVPDETRAMPGELVEYETLLARRRGRQLFAWGRPR